MDFKSINPNESLLNEEDEEINSDYSRLTFEIKESIIEYRDCNIF